MLLENTTLCCYKKENSLISMENCQETEDDSKFETCSIFNPMEIEEEEIVPIQ